MSKSTYQIPFNKQTGEMLHYVDFWTEQIAQIEVKDNYMFEDSLLYMNYKGGRSSMTMILESISTGRKYYMFWKYFDKCIRRPNNSPGPIFHGKWTFIKTGKNYSVKPYEEENAG